MAVQPQRQSGQMSQETAVSSKRSEGARRSVIVRRLKGPFGLPRRMRQKDPEPNESGMEKQSNGHVVKIEPPKMGINCRFGKPLNQGERAPSFGAYF